MKSNHTPIILQLFVALVLLFTLWALKPSVGESEAWWLWVARDVVDVQPAAPGDVLRGVRDNLSMALNRSGGGLNLPAAAALEGWTWLTGDSLEGLRWGGVLLIGLAASAVIRVIGRRNPRRMVRVLSILFVFAPVLVFLQPSDRVAFEIERHQSQRTPADSVLTFFTESSPLGYYQYRYDIRAGIGLDLGWREFTPEELTNIAAKLDSTRPIWLIGAAHHPTLNAMRGVLSASRKVGASAMIWQDTAFWHFR